jgi:hypothetical protein
VTDNPDDRLRMGGWVPSGDDATAAQQLRAVPAPSSDAAARLAAARGGVPVPLEPVQVERRSRGRWWFAVVPAVVVALVVAVAVQFGSGEEPTRRGGPQLPGVALPVVSASARADEPSASTSTSASASARASSSSARPTASTTGSATNGAPATATPTAPTAHRGAVVGIGGRCLAADRDRPELAACQDRSSQRWSRPGDGTVRVLDRCLDVLFSGDANGTPVILYQCNRSDAQQWQVRGDGTWRNPQSNKCLSTVGGRSDPGTRLAVFDCAGGQHQKWTLT